MRNLSDPVTQNLPFTRSQGEKHGPGSHFNFIFKMVFMGSLGVMDAQWLSWEPPPHETDSLAAHPPEALCGTKFKLLGLESHTCSTWLRGGFVACELAFSLVTLSAGVRCFPSPPAHHPFQAWLRFTFYIATAHEVPRLKWESRRKEWAGGEDLPRSRWPRTLPNFTLTIGKREGRIL